MFVGGSIVICFCFYILFSFIEVFNMSIVVCILFFCEGIFYNERLVIWLYGYVMKKLLFVSVFVLFFYGVVFVVLMLVGEFSDIYFFY